MRRHNRRTPSPAHVASALIPALVLALGTSGCDADKLLFKSPVAQPSSANLALALLASPEGADSQEAPEGVRIRILVRGEGGGSVVNLRIDTVVVAPPGEAQIELLLPIPIGARKDSLTAAVGVEVRWNERSIQRGEARATMRRDRTTDRSHGPPQLQESCHERVSAYQRRHFPAVLAGLESTRQRTAPLRGADASGHYWRH